MCILNILGNLRVLVGIPQLDYPVIERNRLQSSNNTVSDEILCNRAWNSRIAYTMLK